MGSGDCRQEAASAGHPQHRLAPPRLAFFRRGLRDRQAVEYLRLPRSGPLRLEETKTEIPCQYLNPTRDRNLLDSLLSVLSVSSDLSEDSVLSVFSEFSAVRFSG